MHKFSFRCFPEDLDKFIRKHFIVPDGVEIEIDAMSEILFKAVFPRIKIDEVSPDLFGSAHSVNRADNRRVTVYRRHWDLGGDGYSISIFQVDISNKVDGVEYAMQVLDEDRLLDSEYFYSKLNQIEQSVDEKIFIERKEERMYFLRLFTFGLFGRT